METPAVVASTPAGDMIKPTTTSNSSKRLERLGSSLAPPLPLIRFPTQDLTDFEVPMRSGFNYTLPELELPEVSHATTSPLDNAVRPIDAAKECKLLSEFMTENEVLLIKRRDVMPLQVRLVYKRIKTSQIASPVNAAAPVLSPTPTPASCADTDATKSSATKTPLPSSPREPKHDNLEFNSFFECGNLDRAYRVVGRVYMNDCGVSPAQRVDQEYDLYCDCDILTQRHVQWYFFRVQLPASKYLTTFTPDVLRVRFNIRNMQKRASLYNLGMQPAVYTEELGWHHAGENVCYFKNTDTYVKARTNKPQHFYTLTFVYEFALPAAAATSSQSQQPSDSSKPLVVYFAHCYPYSYTRLQKYLQELQRDPERNQYLRRRVLCKTIAGNLCNLITITEFGSEADAKQRKGIVLTARVHPGESNTSFILHGILGFLTGNSMEARYLRHHFVFKIVPMLNPDGVIHGNYRCSLAACDLNRRWIDPNKSLHPTIHATKAVVLALARTRGVALFCDLHGHSKKKNIFLYCCRQYSSRQRHEAAQVRVFPFVLHKTSLAANDGFFSYEDCRFSVQPSKKSTGRVVIWNEGHVLHSFTLESSFFGWENGSINQPLRHFTIQHFMRAGEQFCKALIPFQRVLGLDENSAVPPCSPTTPDDQSKRGEGAAQPLQPGEEESPAIISTNPQTDGGQSTSASGTSNSSDDVEEDEDLRMKPGSTRVKGVAVVSATEEESIFCLIEDYLDTNNLMSQLEQSLPDNLEDDDDDSDGSESDASDDDTKPDERDLNSTLEKVSQALTEPAPEHKLPKLAKIRARRSLGQEQFQLIPSLAKHLAPLQQEPKAQQPPAPEPTPTPATLTSPVSTSAPAKKPQERTKLRRTRSAMAYELPNDRNGEIAMMHLRVVQRRFVSKRTRDSRRSTPSGTPPNEPALDASP